MEPTAQWIVLAHILRPQGRRGEVLADLFTDFPKRFVEHPRVWLAPPGFADLAAADPALAGGAQQVEVASHWLPVGKNAGRIVLHFAGVDTIERAQEFAGRDVIVPLSERMALESGAAYVSDLVGCTVYDRGVALGVIEGVQFPTSPDGSRRLEEAASLLAVLSPEGDEVLVPFASEFILGLDLTAKSIRMALPEGLSQINHPAARRQTEK